MHVTLPQDAASFKAELSYRGPVSGPEPEPVYSMEAADYREASSQQGLAYATEAVYESAEAPGHYPAGTGAPRCSALPRAGSSRDILLDLWRRCEEHGFPTDTPLLACYRVFLSLEGSALGTFGASAPVLGPRKIPIVLGRGGQGQRKGGFQLPSCVLETKS